MHAALTLAIALAAQSATVQTAVDDPLLPTGPLHAAGAAAEGDVYVDAKSFERSDIPGLVRGTAVIVTADAAAPLQVVLAWIDCRRRVYQLSSGRRYDAAGREVARTAWVRDQPIPAGGGPDRLAAAFCPAAPDPSAMEVVADHRAALARSRSATR